MLIREVVRYDRFQEMTARVVERRRSMLKVLAPGIDLPKSFERRAKFTSYMRQAFYENEVEINKALDNDDLSKALHYHVLSEFYLAFLNKEMSIGKTLAPYYEYLMKKAYFET